VRGEGEKEEESLLFPCSCFSAQHLFIKRGEGRERRERKNKL